MTDRKISNDKKDEFTYRYYEVGRSMMLSGEKEKALEMLEKAAEFSDHKVKEVLEELEKAYRANGRYEEALRVLEDHLIPDSPRSTDLYREKAELHDLNGDPVMVIKTYEKLASLRKKDLEPYMLIVEFLASNGYMEKAMEYLFKMEKSVSGGDWTNLAFVLRLHRMITGDEDRARLLMEEKEKGLLGTKGGFRPKEFLFERAYLLRDSNPEEAEMCLIGALDQDRNDFNCNLLFARLLRRRGDTVTARDHYQRCIDADPHNEMVRKEMSTLIM